MLCGISEGKLVLKFAKSWWCLFVLSKCDEDLINRQDVQLEFRRVLRHYCLL